MVLYRGGDSLQALKVYEENLELARSLGQQSLVTTSLYGVCQLLLATGEFERAEPLAEELQDDHYLADCAMHRRDYTLAARHYSRNLELWIREGDVVSQTFQVLGFAMALAGLGRDEDALRLEASIDATWEELGVAVRPRVLETWRRARPRRSPCQARRAASVRRLRGGSKDEMGPGCRARARRGVERVVGAIG